MPVEFVATAVPPVRIRLSEIFKTIIVSMLQSNGLNKREVHIPFLFIFNERVKY